MAGGYGFAGHIGFAKESSGNTPVAATNYVEALSESLNVSISRFETVNIHGSYTEPDDTDGIRNISGNIVASPDPESLGYFLLGALGNYTKTQVVSGSALHTHTFKVRTSDWDDTFAEQPFTFEIGRASGTSQQYSGVNVGQIEFNVSGNNAVQMTAQLLGLGENNISATTPTYPASESRFDFSTASLAIGGTANVNFEALTITLNNNLEAIPGMANTGKFNNKIKRGGPSTVRVAGDISFENMTEYNDFRNQTERSFSASFTAPDSFQLVIDVPRMVFTTFPLEMGGRDRIVVGVEALGRYHSGSATNIGVKLTNVTSSY